MAKAETTSTARHVLLVEGRDDESVVYGFSKVYTQMPAFEILRKNGINLLLEDIHGEILVDNRKAIGIMVDANNNLTSRWQSVADRLLKASIRPPAKPDPKGTIINPTITVINGNPRVNRPRVGVWLMPDNKSSGELEDFIARLIPAGDQVWPLSAAYIDGIPEESRKFRPTKTQRAKVHAWLATRRRPLPMGTAITAKDLDIKSAEGQLFLDWLRRLFR